MLTVSSVTEADRQDALALLFEHLPPAEKSDQAAMADALAEEGELSWEGLLTARDEHRLLGVCLTVIQADRSLGVWIPVIASSARRIPTLERAIAAALLQEVVSRQDRFDLPFAQCLLEETPSPAERWLINAGFEQMAELSFLHCDLTQPLPAVPHQSFESEVFQPGVNEARFAALVEQSYRNSLDCPKFTGLRTGAEALKSHRTTGEFRPEMWRLFRSAESDAGVLLCADHPDLDAWELAYMGVRPEARGRGLGRAMVVFAIEAAKNAGRKQLQLAVDSVNRYAKDIYETFGFTEHAHRTVYLRRRDASHQHVLDES
ncbi:MAG: GNAT family N-acetyltransferase [Planctomycetota bacterium]|nr:GNAT family N-acetyltransferase [Planctomycetota bacterium]MDA1212366.1 GNAT family N-acetyltransferase [Planctomycetota bacterium]